MAPPSRALTIRALIPALEMNQLRPARCGLSHETRGRSFARIGDAAKQLLHRDAPSQHVSSPRDRTARPGIQPWGNDEAATQVAKSPKAAPSGKPCSVVVFWMLAFASMTICSSRAARRNATGGDRHGQSPAPLDPKERRRGGSVRSTPALSARFPRRHSTKRAAGAGGPGRPIADRWSAQGLAPS